MGRPKKSDRDIATATRLIEAAELHFARVASKRLDFKISLRTLELPVHLCSTITQPKKPSTMR